VGLEMDRTQRLFVGVALPVLFIALTFGPWLVVRGDLPNPIAVHFAGDGTANGSMSVLVHLLVSAAFTVAASAVLVWAAWRPSSTLGLEAAIAAFMGWLISFVSALIVFANQGHDDWHSVTLSAGSVWGATFSALGASIPVALMVRHAASERASLPPRPIELGGTERVAWFGRASSLPFAAGSVTLVFTGTVVLLAFAGGGASTGLVLLAVGLLMVSFMSVDVAVSDQGVRVRAGALHWPHVQLDLDEIEGARAVDLKPMQEGMWSGWGYRGSLRWFRRAAWVLRSGPALELDLTGDRRFAVTVDDADEAAAVLNGLLARASG
jgi:hypothetical protein